MENIHEILKEFGLEVPTEKRADFDKAWKENYRTKAEYENAARKRDEYKTSLDDVNKKLKEFDGVDVADLKGQIATLQDDLKKKDAEYAAKEADRAFNETLKDAIQTAGGRNAKAVMALLDIDALKASKNQDKDILTAINDVKKDSDYMFAPDKPVPRIVSSTPGVSENTDNLKTKANDALRSALGRG